MFNVDQLRLKIEALLREHPELADDDELRLDMLDGETDFKHVLARLYTANDDAEGDIVILNMQIADRKIRRERFKRHIEFYRELMLLLLQSADLKKVVLAEATLSQVKGTQEIVGEPNPDVLPDDLVRIKREPDRPAIREALLNGRELPGLALSNAAPKLTIRGK